MFEVNGRKIKSCGCTHLVLKQGAMSSSPGSVEDKQPVCWPMLTLRESGLCIVAQGLKAVPLKSTTRWNRPKKSQKIVSNNNQLYVKYYSNKQLVQLSTQCFHSLSFLSFLTSSLFRIQDEFSGNRRNVTNVTRKTKRNATAITPLSHPTRSFLQKVTLMLDCSRGLKFICACAAKSLTVYCRLLLSESNYLVGLSKQLWRTFSDRR